jgi:hypothetical protein
MSEREPDIDDDPRRQGTGQGYPESNPEGATPAEGTDSGPEAGTGDTEAPDTSAGQDESPSDATGNPGAAGG